MTKLQLQLPPALIGRAHLAQLIRELEDVENDFEKQKAHGKYKADLKMPTMSRALGDCVELNKIDMMSGQARMHFKSALGEMKDKAPTIHFTFAADPDGASLQRLTDYVRKEIHPQALISVGLQPALIGGVYMRTPNKVHDYSLRRVLHEQRGLVAKSLESLKNGKPLKPVEAAPAQAKAPAKAPAGSKA